MNRGKPKDNKSGFKGVDFCKQSNKYRARISIDGKQTLLGYFDDKLDAYKAYCDACVKYHKEYHHF